jgi:hypothetical protein
MNAKAKVGLLVSILGTAAALQSPAQAAEQTGAAATGAQAASQPSSAVDSVLQVLAKIAAVLYPPTPN